MGEPTLEMYKENIIKIVKNMLKLGETEEKIEKYIGISKREIDEIKGMEVK